MKQKLEDIRARAKAQLSEFTDLSELENFRVQVLGKKGELTGILKSMGALSAEERPKMGQLANEVRASIETMLADKMKELKEREMQREIESTPLFDVSATQNIVDSPRRNYLLTRLLPPLANVTCLTTPTKCMPQSVTAVFR